MACKTSWAFLNFFLIVIVLKYNHLNKNKLLFSKHTAVIWKLPFCLGWFSHMSFVPLQLILLLVWYFLLRKSEIRSLGIVWAVQVAKLLNGLNWNWHILFLTPGVSEAFFECIKLLQERKHFNMMNKHRFIYQN